jgi:hypothetical protein
MTSRSPELAQRGNGETMIRPAERFPVNIAPDMASATMARPRVGRTAGPSLLMLALLVGAGIGGLLPTDGPDWQDADAAIEPAAGPVAVPQEVVRAPDGAFYVSVTLDRVPLVVRLDPSSPTSELRPADAMRLAPAGRLAETIDVSELELGGRTRGPLTLPVAGADSPVSVLGADLLDGFGVSLADQDHLRLSAR